MRIAISNIAWDISEDETVAALLNKYEIDAIDIAPTKYFPVPGSASIKEIYAIHQWWVSRGIEITGLQSLLFGTTDLNIFGGVESQMRMEQHLNTICTIGSILGASRLVFGSPKNRLKGSLDNIQTKLIAVPFFKRLGDVARSRGVTICLEPNPECYGADFMTNTRDTLDIVKEVNHSNIKLHLDIGAITINGEDTLLNLIDYKDYIGHVHVSEPNLVPIGDGPTKHDIAGSILNVYMPEQLVSIEMVATKDEDHLVSIERAIITTINAYR